MRALPTLLTTGLIAIGWLPICSMAYASINSLGEPAAAEVLRVSTGTWALRWLAMGLIVPPIAFLGGMQVPTSLRRMLGLLCFGYATAHVAVMLIGPEAWPGLGPHVVLGVASYTLLLPMLATTLLPRVMRGATGAIAKRAGPAVWVAAACAVLHLGWVSTSLGETTAWACALALGWVARGFQKRASVAASPLVKEAA